MMLTLLRLSSTSIRASLGGSAANKIFQSTGGHISWASPKSAG